MMRLLLISVAACNVTLAAQSPNYQNAEVTVRKPLIDIFPPSNRPGEVLKHTAFAKVDRALGEVLKLGRLLQNRRCALGVANAGHTQLQNPVWAIRDGKSYSAIPRTVRTNQTSLNLFHKPIASLGGSVGVMSYDISGTNHKVVIMWNVPGDIVFCSIKFNMKVYRRHVVTDRALCRHMESFEGGYLSTNKWHERTEYGITLRGTMTDNIYSKLIVWVNADGFDPNEEYDSFTHCPYNPWKVGKRCRQECYGGGACWVNKKCNDDEDCVGRPPMKCSSNC